MPLNPFYINIYTGDFTTLVLLLAVLLFVCSAAAMAASCILFNLLIQKRRIGIGIVYIVSQSHRPAPAHIKLNIVSCNATRSSGLKPKKVCSNRKPGSEGVSRFTFKFIIHNNVRSIFINECAKFL